MGGYGLHLLVQSSRIEAPDEIDHPLTLFGVPLSSSLDRLLAGTSLGLLGFRPDLSAVICGVVTAVLTFIGLRIGRAGGRLIRIRADLPSGIVLVVLAVVLALEFLRPFRGSPATPVTISARCGRETSTGRARTYVRPRGRSPTAAPGRSHDSMPPSPSVVRRGPGSGGSRGGA
jgi:Putative manganese efflux pump